MKTPILPLMLLALGACTACNGVKTVTNGELKLEIDHRMYWRVTSLAAGAEALGTGFAPSGALVTDQCAITDFELIDARRIGGGVFGIRHLRK